VERRVVLRHQDGGVPAERRFDLLVEAQHRGRILGLAGVVLLAIRHADLGCSRHGDARLGAVDPGLPGSRRRDDLPVLVLNGLLAEVPDVPVGILRVPVVRVLDRDAVFGDEVMDDASLDPHHLARLLGDPHGDRLLVSFRIRLAIDPRRPRRHRPEWVVDLGRELRRVERHRVAALREHRRLVTGAPGQRKTRCAKHRHEQGFHATVTLLLVSERTMRAVEEPSEKRRGRPRPRRDCQGQPWHFSS
jgi:hypothetical protein